MKQKKVKTCYIKIEIVDEFRSNKYSEPYKKVILLEPLTDRGLSKSEYTMAIMLIEKEIKKTKI